MVSGNEIKRFANLHVERAYSILGVYLIVLILPISGVEDRLNVCRVQPSLRPRCAHQDAPYRQPCYAIGILDDQPQPTHGNIEVGFLAHETFGSGAIRSSGLVPETGHPSNAFMPVCALIIIRRCRAVGSIVRLDLPIRWK